MEAGCRADMLESYAILAAQFKALLGQLRAEGGGGASEAERLLFKGLVLLPNRLAMDPDPHLRVSTSFDLG